MTRTAQSIEHQITSYVSRLSIAKQKAVLMLLQKFDENDEDEHRAAFEKKWAQGGLTPEELRQDLLQHVRGFEWKK